MLGILYSTSDWSPLRDPFIESLNIMEECTQRYISAMKLFPRMVTLSLGWDPSLVQSRIKDLGG